MKTSSREIWTNLTPQQRANLFFVAEVDVAEVTGLIEDTTEDETGIEEALHRAGVGEASWGTRNRGSVLTNLVKKGLIKSKSTWEGEHHELTPLGRRVIKHVEAILLGKAPAITKAFQETRPEKKSPAQLDAEIAETLAKETR